MKQQLNRIEQKLDKLLGLPKSKIPPRLTIEDIHSYFGVTRYQLKKVEHQLTNYNPGGKTSKKVFDRNEVQKVLAANRLI